MVLEVIGKLAACEFVFIAKIVDVVGNMMSMSMPPIHHKQITFTDKQFMRGTPKIDEKSYTYQVRQVESPEFRKDIKYVVAGHRCEGHSIIDYIYGLEDGELYQAVLELPSIPVGWTKTTQGWQSPFPQPETSLAWYNDSEWYGKVSCCLTLRPAANCYSQNIELSVEQVKNVDDVSLEHKAPFGDGCFIVTIKNNGTDVETVDALLSDENGKISWEDSLILVDRADMKAYALPGAAKKSHLKPTQLKASEEKKIKVNTLTIPGSKNHWRVGGTRVYLQFCVGNLCKTNFFYYFKDRHEKMHENFIGKCAFSDP